MVHTITIFTAKNMAWKNTSSFESINTFINMNYEGLKDDALSMLAGKGFADLVFVPRANAGCKSEYLLIIIQENN